MSLLIKGMGLPNNCNTCAILQTGYLEHYCPLAKEVMDGSSIVRGRHRYCPLVDVPAPHGELIDRDELLRECQMLDLETGFDIEKVEDMVNEALTIIEAENDI